MRAPLQAGRETLMTTKKGGSALDVLNDLKLQRPAEAPTLEPKRTRMGLQAPEGGLPPVPGSSPSSSRSIPPPPPSQRPRRNSGVLSNPLANAAGDTAPSSSRLPRDEEERAEDTSPGIPPDATSAAAP